MTTTFADLGVNARLLSALARNSIDTPVTVQVEAIPPLLRGRDVVIQAPTGSGKTLAFILPLIERLMAVGGPGPRALVVTPTRELAIQVDRVFQSLSTGLKSALLYGGVGYVTQEHALKAGVDVVIGTPGRTLDMVSRRRLSLSRVQLLVLDEGDEMLDAGFAPDVERIIELTYQPQIVLASATMPDWVSRMIERHLHDPERIRIAAPSEEALEHGLLRVGRAEKLHTLSRLLRKHRGSAIVFGRTKHGVRKLSRDLRNLGHDSADLQGNLSQNVRDRTMDAFRDLRTDQQAAEIIAQCRVWKSIHQPICPRCKDAIEQRARAAERRAFAHTTREASGIEHTLSHQPRALWTDKIWFVVELGAVATLVCLAVLAAGGWWR